MWRALIIVATTIVGTHAYAQSIEERLQECIAQSQRVLRYADAWKASLEVIGERARPREFAEIVTSYAYEDLLKGTIKSLKSNDDPVEIVSDIELATDPIQLRTDLIEGMVDEAYAGENRFEAMAEYISACTENFGGETYQLQDIIEELEIALSQVNKDKDTLKAKLENQISDLTKRLKTATVLLENKEAKLLEYEQTIIGLKGFDTVAYLDGLVTMGALERNKEIYEGKFSKAKLETADELSCLSKLRDRGQLSDACRDVLTAVLNRTLYND